jgi:putative flavoprotein involved in K+ transport
MSGATAERDPRTSRRDRARLARALGIAHALHATTKRYGVELEPRLVDVDGRTARFQDGSELEVDAVIWATGYRPDYSWIGLPVFDADGRLRHRRGVTDVPGLHFLGLTWQHTRGSALIGFIKDDAEFIAEKIASYQESKAREPAQVPVGSRQAAETERT